MNWIGTAVVEHVDPRVSNQFFPVGAVGFISVARGLPFHDLGLLIAEHRQARRELCRRVDVGNLLVGVCVALAHETASEHADAKLLLRTDRYFAYRHIVTPVYAVRY